MFDNLKRKVKKEITHEVSFDVENIDLNYINKCIGMIMSDCLAHDIEIISIEHIYRYPSIRKELTNIKIRLKTSVNNKVNMDKLMKYIAGISVLKELK